MISAQKPFGLRTYYKGQEEPFINSIKVYANQCIGYASRSEITDNIDWIDKYKIIIPRAIGIGDSLSDYIKPLCSEPNSCCTETYVVLGPLISMEEVKNIMSYINTRFFHFLLTLKKNTMMASKTVYSFIPIQDFSESWSDKKLYKKYELTKEEIDFIESIVRPDDKVNFINQEEE